MPVAAISAAVATPDAAHQVGVVGRAQADVVREDGRAHHSRVTMHCVDAVEQRDAQPGRQRGLLVAVDHSQPVRGRVAGRRAAAAAEHRADEGAGHVARLDAALLDLRHLTDLLGQGHLGQQGRDALVDALGGRGRWTGNRRRRRSDRAAACCQHKDGE